MAPDRGDSFAESAPQYLIVTASSLPIHVGQNKWKLPDLHPEALLVEELFKAKALVFHYALR